MICLLTQIMQSTLMLKEDKEYQNDAVNKTVGQGVYMVPDIHYCRIIIIQMAEDTTLLLFYNILSQIHELKPPRNRHHRTPQLFSRPTP